MRHRTLAAYFVVLVALCAAVIGGARLLGRQGAYLAQVYMLTPAMAAIIARTFFHRPRFADAGLKFGRIRNYLYAWLASLGMVALYFGAYTLLGAVTWDLSGDVFLGRLAGQFAAAGQDMTASLPRGFTPHTMLLVYVIGGLTVFNILPGLVNGLGEEFGHRGLMFPFLYQINPWIGFVGGGLIWFAWHLPLMLVVPVALPVPQGWSAAGNWTVLAVGSICTFIYLAYVYARTGSIFVAAIAHISMNNASMALSYFIVVRDQVLANLGTTLIMVLVVALLYGRGELAKFGGYFRQIAPATWDRMTDSAAVTRMDNAGAGLP